MEFPCPLVQEFLFRSRLAKYRGGNNPLVTAHQNIPDGGIIFGLCA